MELVPKERKKVTEEDLCERVSATSHSQERAPEEESRRKTYLQNGREKTTETTQSVTLIPGDFGYIPGNLEKERSETGYGDDSLILRHH